MENATRQSSSQHICLREFSLFFLFLHINISLCLYLSCYVSNGKITFPVKSSQSVFNGIYNVLQATFIRLFARVIT